LCGQVGTIFISYVSEDAGIAREIAGGLESAGYCTWYFEHNVVSGSSYVRQISQALDQCHALVLVASPRSVGSDQVTKEVMGAFERGKPLFPVLVELRPSKLKQLQPEWRHAIGVASMVIVGPQGAPACCKSIIDGLKALGIQPGSTRVTSAHSVPKHLAEKILAARPSMEGERKQVTVLFADVSGFTSLSEKLDPEEVHGLISEALVPVCEEIHRYEGTIVQFLGDGIMALFGAPIAHEDAPQRALHSALGIRERIRAYAAKLKQQGIEFDMHIGLNSGLVMVGKIGDDLTMEYTAMGDTVNLASRVATAAQPGVILLSENTHRLTEGYFDFLPPNEIQVKGKKEALKAYQLVGPGRAKTRIDVSVARGLTPFVGRQKELGHLLDCYERVKRGQGQVVGIVGEPGVGKSRLLLQLKSMMPQEEHGYLVGECLHYGEGMAYLPLVNALRSYFDIEEGEPQLLSQRKLKQRISQLDERLMAVLPPLQELLSLQVEDAEFLKLEPQRKRVRIFEAIWSLIIRESQNRPVVLAFEDLHWVDKASEEFLNYLIGRLSGSHVLLLLLYRPEYTPIWVSKACYSQIRVDEFTLETSAEMVQAILKGTKVAEDLSHLILDKSAGNPLFMEEFTRALLERGYIQRKNGHYVLSVKPSDIQVPETVQGIIAARMDRLEKELKETMQTASVIGREFSFPILQTVTGMREKLEACLLELQALEYIYEKSVFPELEYMFKHALTQQVAYNSLLLKKRKEIHESIGQAIETLYPERLEDFYEALAFHFKNGASTDKAIDYLIKAGEKGFERYAVVESHRHFKDAYDLLSPRVGQVKGAGLQLIDLLIKWAYVFYFRGDLKGLSDLLEAHKELAESLDDKVRFGMYYAWLGFSLAYRCRLRDSYSHLHQALQLGKETKSELVIGYSYCWLTSVCWVMGLLDEAVASGEQALEICRFYENDQYLYYKTLGIQGIAYYAMGHKRKVFEAGQALLEYSRRRGSIRGEVMGHTCMALGYLLEGDYSVAITHCRQGIEAAADPYYKMIPETFLVVCDFMNGDLSEAEEISKKHVDFSCEYAGELHEHTARSQLTLVPVLKGDLNALAAHEDSLNKLLEVGAKVYSNELCAAIATGFALLSGIVPDADRKAKLYFEKTIALAQEIGSKRFLGQGYLGLGQLCGAAGDNNKARQYISQAIPLFEECELDTYLKQAREALESLK
jgi:class 3 adenylate cyclase/tetratricopeptide (TPR) repeat protein